MNILLPLVELEREPQGYIQPGALSELWFHTGTACNLACPFCFEGSKPGDGRLERITLVDAQPLIDEAVSLGARQFSFTGGEPFIVKDFVNILRYASNSNPCLVLTNGTDPLLKRLRQIEPLLSQPHSVSFRVSIDYPNRRTPRRIARSRFIRKVMAQPERTARAGLSSLGGSAEGCRRG